ncbi:hypothetical protein GQ600_7600 [Phytophthora cactorum]|nr:hypothetical protein GQ600_16719 [Phytophthora cactorum]KAF1783587.1 hypothetical protein GQ600_7600 [Phytophthora cactorum]
MANGVEDANTRLGVHVGDLSKETPPNPFLFPRSFLKMHLLHDTVGIHPFLPAYPPQILQWQQPNPITESCAGKFFLSAAMGRLRHGQRFRSGTGQLRRHHATSTAPRTERTTQSTVAGVGTAAISWVHCSLSYGAYCCCYCTADGWVMESHSRQVPLLGQQLPRYFGHVLRSRVCHREDPWTTRCGQELVAGCATGAALAAGQGFQAQCLGCAGFAAFSYAINVFTGGKF